MAKLLVACAVVVLLLFGVGMSPIPATTKTVATIASSETEVVAGETFTLTGHLQKDTGVFGSSWVTIQYRQNGATKWLDAKSLKTDSAGDVTYVPGDISKNIDYRVVFTGTDQYAASASAPITVSVVESVNITLTSATTVAVGQSITVKGTTSPALAGSPASLQVLTGSDWDTVATGVVDHDSAFGVEAVATQGGKTSYRVVVDGPQDTPAYSSIVKFNVYQWYALGDENSGASENVLDRVDTAAVAGDTFSDALAGSLDANSSVMGEFSLADCNGFSATIGLSGSVDASSSVTFTVVKDDVATEAGLGKEGVGERIFVDLVGGSRLRLENVRVSGVGSTTAIWGDPEVLCLNAP